MPPQVLVLERCEHAAIGQDCRSSVWLGEDPAYRGDNLVLLCPALIVEPTFI